jgi:hypothetical protein
VRYGISRANARSSRTGDRTIKTAHWGGLRSIRERIFIGSAAAVLLEYPDPADLGSTKRDFPVCRELGCSKRSWCDYLVGHHDLAGKNLLDFVAWHVIHPLRDGTKPRSRQNVPADVSDGGRFQPKSGVRAHLGGKQMRPVLNRRRTEKPNRQERSAPAGTTIACVKPRKRSSRQGRDAEQPSQTASEHGRRFRHCRKRAPRSNCYR